MKILALSTSHDSNWCYFDTEEGKLYYFSAERDMGVKKARVNLQDVFFFMRKKFNFNPTKHRDDIFIYSTIRNNNAIDFVDSTQVDIPESLLYMQNRPNVYIVDHHYGHILSSLALNPSATQGICIDAKGNHNSRTTIYYNLGDIANTQRVRVDNISIGKCFSTFSEKICPLKKKTYMIDYAWSPEFAVGKVMGLQAYGKINQDLYNEWSNMLPQDLNKKGIDDHFNEVNVYDPTGNFDEVTTFYQFLSDKIVELFDKYIDKSRPVVYAGGCALSTVANDKLLNKGYDLTVCPAANDSGIAIGLMKFADLHFNLGIDFSNLVFSSNEDIEAPEIPQKNVDFAAKCLSEGKIIALCVGAGEVGPRALGHRSILMNPSIENGKDYINKMVKHREWWRPFGGSTIDTSIIEDYKESNLDYYMLRNFTLKPEWHDRLNSIYHADGTCRLQILKNKDEALYRIIDKFNQLTGIPTVLDTSFNDNGKPIPNYRRDIMSTYAGLDNIDYLFYNDRIYTKKDNKVVEITDSI